MVVGVDSIGSLPLQIDFSVIDFDASPTQLLHCDKRLFDMSVS